MNDHNLAYLSRISLVAFPIDIHNFQFTQIYLLNNFSSIIHRVTKNLRNTFYLSRQRVSNEEKNERSKPTRFALLLPSSLKRVERHPEFRDPSATVGQAKH